MDTAMAFRLLQTIKPTKLAVAYSSMNMRNFAKKAEKRKRSVLNHYCALNTAEFFAVATESFLEKPRQMKKKHPELLDELSKYCGINPFDWVQID